MKRTILLLEPNYKNKYPPMGLMKLATYYRLLGDDIRYFKGDLKTFAAQLLFEEFIAKTDYPISGIYIKNIIEYIKTGKLILLTTIPNFKDSYQEQLLKNYHYRYKTNQFPNFDIICVTTLFTFYWRQTINTINYAKYFCSKNGKIIIGGIAATILPDNIFKETGIQPICGLLDKPGILDDNNSIIIDELPLDYSILEEIDYTYPSSNAYIAYMTRGCPRKCPFCAVPRIEPKYKEYISLEKNIQIETKRFGPRKDLLLMDNNVLASRQFNRIIDEIKKCGFGKEAFYTPENEYNIALENIRDKYNIRGYTKKIIKLYDSITEKLPENYQGEFYLKREKNNLLYADTATRDAIIEFDSIVHPLYDKYFKKKQQTRYIDFNQGIDARLIDENKMKKLAEINIRPLRIAFDNYSMKDTYINAIRIAAKYGITHLSNYLLYNYKDTPDELYARMKINIDLCEEIGVSIFSFPMKYHPIDDPKFFYNREYIGVYWNRKFIRSIQSVLNATKGKIGQGRSFFNEAFGKNLDEFHKILWMPEAFIIHRLKYKNNLTAEWWEKYNYLDEKHLKYLQNIIAKNIFKENIETGNKNIDDVLRYYYIK